MLMPQKGHCMFDIGKSHASSANSVVLVNRPLRRMERIFCPVAPWNRSRMH